MGERMEHLRRAVKVVILIAIAVTLVFSGLLYKNTPKQLVSADADKVEQKTTQDNSPVRDKESNTARIVEKEAWWTNPEAYEANLLLKVDGSSLSGPMDVVFVLDRSGSMDMTYTDNANMAEYEGYPLFSCPCLNQEHFYLEPLHPTSEPEINADQKKVYDNGDHTLTVYNADVKQWEVIGTTPVHLFEQFTQDTAKYIPYHFKREGNTFVRISHWDSDAVVAGKVSPGVWVHAEESQGCYDRWILSKKAITEVSGKLFQEHPDNRVALVPFSIRDSSMVEHLNYNSARMNNFRGNLTSKNGEKGYFGAATGTSVDDTGTIMGNYDSMVGWKNSIAENKAALEDMLPRLFTTPQTDYQYGLSKAYNLLQSRSDEAKAAKGAMVVFLSDGVPQSTATMRVGWGGGGSIVSFGQTDDRILALSKAITSDGPVQIEGALSGAYQRHDIQPDYLRPIDGTVYEAAGMGAEMLAVDYMANSAILKSMANDPQNYLEVPADNVGAGEAYLSDLLLNSTLFPGGRDSILRDEVSKYYYVPENAVLPEGVTVEGNYEDRGEAQTIVWNLGDLYDYTTESYPSITIPLVLKNDYRQVNQATYYPTNADTSEKATDIYDPDRGVDDEDTGAKLYYKAPDNQSRYDTIGTPKLSVSPKVNSTSYKLQAKKHLSGRNLLAGEFTFELLDDSGKLIQTTTNDAAGQIRFGEISYTAAGDYEYIIREKAGVDKTIDYDTAQHKVSVHVKVVNEQLIATATGESEAYFENNYHPLSTSITFKARKELIGKDLSAKSFTFELLDDSNKVIQTATNDASGQVNFEQVSYAKAGEYNYTIREQQGEDPCIVYDRSSYKVHVKVEDNKGQLVATPTYEKEALFKNIYNSQEKMGLSKNSEKNDTEKVKNEDETLPKSGELYGKTIVLAGVGLLILTVAIFGVIKAMQGKN